VKRSGALAKLPNTSLSHCAHYCTRTRTGTRAFTNTVISEAHSLKITKTSMTTTFIIKKLTPSMPFVVKNKRTAESILKIVDMDDGTTSHTEISDISSDGSTRNDVEFKMNNDHAPHEHEQDMEVDETEMPSESTQEEEDEEIESDEQKPKEDSAPRRRKSILKRTVSDLDYLKNSRGAWKVLPKPDLGRITRSISAPASLEKAHKRDFTVSFKEVQIRCYSQTAGDNPSVSCGTPITLDWDYEEMEPVCIDKWEETHPPRRSLRQLILSYYQRRNLLTWQYGFSEDELRQAKREANKIRSKREMTRAFLPAMMVESVLESAVRKAKRILRKQATVIQF
jgi:hypothetical protein